MCSCSERPATPEHEHKHSDRAPARARAGHTSGHQGKQQPRGETRGQHWTLVMKRWRPKRAAEMRNVNCLQRAWGQCGQQLRRQQQESSPKPHANSLTRGNHRCVGSSGLVNTVDRCPVSQGCQSACVMRACNAACI